MVSLLAFILLIGPIIFIHELGHLLAAKLVLAGALAAGLAASLLTLPLGQTGEPPPAKLI